MPTKRNLKSINDGWENVTTGLGRSKDKRLGGRISVLSSSQDPIIWSSIYSGDDIAAAIVEIPSREMVRKWIDLSVPDSPELEDYVLGRLDELNSQNVFYKSILWSRIYGAGVILISTDADTGVESLSTPVLPGQRVGALRAFDRWSFQHSGRDSNPLSPTYGMGVDFRFAPRIGGESGAVDRTRMIIIETNETTLDRRNENNGWADSVYIRLEEMIRDYGMAWGTVGNIVLDFSQMVYKIEGLADLLASDKDQVVLDRLSTMDLTRSAMRAVILDAGSEDAQRISSPVTGLPELLNNYSLRLSAGTRIPVTLLMGQSPAGLQATGASDIRIFYDWISSLQEAHLRMHVERLVKLLMLEPESPVSAEPDNWNVVFNPLWQLDEKEKSDIDKTKAETAKIYWDIQALDDSEIRDSIRSDYPINDGPSQSSADQSDPED